MKFTGKAKRLDDIDIPRVAARINVGEDEIHAVLDVETAGRGFDSKGRPRMLFEPHIFWRELGPGPLRDEAAKRGLAYPKWRRDYPADSYPRLIAAMEIDLEKALRSASWGLGQIMGFNCMAAGYPTAREMVADFLDDEEAHLNAMVTFIITKKLDRFLRARDWRSFAAGYNGAGFAKNGYDRKLAASFDRWQKIKDTPYTPGKIAAERPSPDAVVKPRLTVQTPPPAKKPGSGAAVGTVSLLSVIGGALAFWWADAWQKISDAFSGLHWPF